MKTIQLSNTQYATLCRALQELEAAEGDNSRNDLFDRNKLFLLSPAERRAAKKFVGGYLFNDSTTSYLIGVLKKQDK